MSELKSKDIGFGTNAGRRLMLSNGRFNVTKVNHAKDVFRHLINCSWKYFFVYLLLFYIFINLFFAIIFVGIGIHNLNGVSDLGFVRNFLNSFFFSVQTFTTVGYGSVSPKGVPANCIAAIEALLGILSVSVISGILFVRITQSKIGIKFSKNVVIFEHEGCLALMFRIGNSHKTEIIEAKCRVMLSYFTLVNDDIKRAYLPLKLERNEVMFFPLSWTIVHKMERDSPMYLWSKKDFEEKGFEIIILLSGYDETLKEKFYTKYSYSYEEILWNRKFVPAFDVDLEGRTIFDLSKINNTKAT